MFLLNSVQICLARTPVDSGKSIDGLSLLVSQVLGQDPFLEQFKAWLERHLPATAPKTLLGKAIRYTLRFWTRLTPFLQDGRLMLSSNATEQAIKTVGISRKSFLFPYSPAGAAPGWRICMPWWRPARPMEQNPECILRRYSRLYR